MSRNEKTLECLLDLDGETFVIEYKKGLWVKFEAKKVKISQSKPHGIKYSLTLHDRSNKRIMGFDNSHAVYCKVKSKQKPIQCYDHWHSDYRDSGKPYHFTTAAKLLEDFWVEVDKKLSDILSGEGS